MHIPFIALLSTLLSLALAKPSSPSSEDKVARFTALARAGNGVVALDAKLYEEITTGPREYSVSVVLTALESQFKCGPCRTFDPEMRLVAKQWARQPASVRDTHFFASLDFKDGREIFRKLGLNTAPNGRLFLPTSGPRAHPPTSPSEIPFNFNRGGAEGLSAETFSSFLSSSPARLPPFFRRPPNYAQMVGVALAVGGTGAVTVVAWPVVKAVTGNRYVWATSVMPFILLMISGQMWNQIRNPPYMTPNQDGRTNYIANSYGSQYGVETQIVAALYGVLAFAAYTLAFTVPKLEDQVKQRAAVYIWTGVLLFMASALTSLFQIKNGGYPFKLLF